MLTSIFTNKNDIAACVFCKEKYTPHFHSNKYNQATGFTRFLENKNTQIPPSFLIDRLNNGPQTQSVYKKPPFFVYLGAFVFIGIMAWRRYRAKAV